MARFNRAICQQCRKVFVKETEEQSFCCYLCEVHFQGISDGNRKLKSYECKTCKKQFYGLQNKVYCSDSCRSYGTRERVTDHSKANESWVTRKPLIPKKRVPLEELIRRQKVARAFDENGWDHYNKGRKWNKI